MKKPATLLAQGLDPMLWQISSLYEFNIFVLHRLGYTFVHIFVFKNIIR